MFVRVRYLRDTDRALSVGQVGCSSSPCCTVRQSSRRSRQVTSKERLLPTACGTSKVMLFPCGSGQPPEELLYCSSVPRATPDFRRLEWHTARINIQPTSAPPHRVPASNSRSWSSCSIRCQLVRCACDDLGSRHPRTLRYQRQLCKKKEFLAVSASGPKEDPRRTDGGLYGDRAQRIRGPPQRRISWWGSGVHNRDFGAAESTEPATRLPDPYRDRAPTGPASKRHFSGHIKRVLAIACSCVCFVCRFPPRTEDALERLTPILVKMICRFQ